MCPAAIEFTDDGQVLKAFEGKFNERAWPWKCTIQFEATAFQGSKNKEPVAIAYIL